MASFSVANLRNDAKLDGSIERHLVDAQCGPRMSPAQAEDPVDQVGGPVEHRRGLGEAGRRVNVALDTDQLPDTLEVARRCLELSNGVDRADPGRLVALVDTEVSAELTGVGELALLPGELTRGEDQIP